jgi:hypothetical protein
MKVGVTRLTVLLIVLLLAWGALAVIDVAADLQAAINGEAF